MTGREHAKHDDTELWIRIGERVVDPDGHEVGTVEAVALSPTLSRLTHASVSPGGAYTDARLVPVDDLRAGDRCLELTGQHPWPDGFERTYELEYLPPDEQPEGAYVLPYAADDVLLWDTLETPFGVGTVIRDHLPEGREPMYAGTPVRASDGRIGHVAGFLVLRDTDEVSHVLLRHGHLWGRRTVLLPIELVERLEAGELLARGTVAELDRYAID